VGCDFWDGRDNTRTFTFQFDGAAETQFEIQSQIAHTSIDNESESSVIKINFFLINCLNLPNCQKVKNVLDFNPVPRLAANASLSALTHKDRRLHSGPTPDCF